MELPLVPGDVTTSVRQAVGMGATHIAAGVADRVGRFSAAVIRVVMGVWSTGAEVRTGRSRLAEAAAGREVMAALVRVEAGAEAVVSGAGAEVAGAVMEAGAETVETGGEEADSVGQAGEAIPVKESDHCDPSPSTAARERDTGLISVMQPTQTEVN